MSKIYLAISTDEKELENIKALTEVYNDFDGLGVCFHGSRDSDAYKVILERLKGGFITQFDTYFGHHEHDLNSIIFHPKIKVGDWLIKIDSSERINPDFSSNIRPFIKMLENNGISTVYQRSKLLMFRRFPHQNFISTPHFGFHGAQPSVIQIESQGWFHDDKEYVYSLRHERPPFSWVDHYVRYYLILDSNQNLLGAEHFGDIKEVFQMKESIRLQFLLLLQKLDINNDVQSLKNYILSNPLSADLKWFFNNIRILNDFYHYHINKDTTLIDDIARPCREIS